jgi:branched-chain amino acid transport system permease protein
MAPGLRDIPEGTNGAASGVSTSDRDGSRHGKSWVGWLVSDDPPGRLLLNVIMLVVLAAFVFAPFLFPGTKALGVASRICIFVILVASYDLMLGYTGIVSFAHTMFFGIGAYGVAILLAKGWVGWGR